MRNLRQLAASPASWAVVFVILGIQAVITAAGGASNPWVGHGFNLFGLNRSGVCEGKAWQIFTYGLLHGSWQHAGLNSLFVLLVGSRVEHMVGRLAMLKAVAAGILSGGVMHLVFAAGGGGSALLVGLSGGCISLLLLLTTLSPQSRMMPLPISGRSLGMGILLAELILAVVDPVLGIPRLSAVGKWMSGAGLGSWFQFGHACHFGGGMAGWAFGRWILRPRITLKSLRADRERREAGRIG